MKITVVGKFYVEGFALHIAETLKDLFHTVFMIDPGLKNFNIKGKFGHRINQAAELFYTTSAGIPFLRFIRSNNLIDEITETCPDLIIVCHDFLSPKEVLLIKKKTGAPIVMWFPDSMANFGRAYFMNASYDGLFFKDPYLVRVLGKVLHTPTFYLPECCNPIRHTLDPISQLKYEKKFPFDIEIAIAGNQHSWRVAFYSQLTEFNTKVWGNPPPLWMPKSSLNNMYQGYGIYNKEKAFIFNKSKIIVNNLLYSEVEGVNARCFEVAAARGFQLIDFKPSLEELFSIDKEIVTFSGMKDLKEKIKYWLPRDEERLNIAEAAFKKVISNHTYKHRLEEIIDKINLT